MSCALCDLKDRCSETELHLLAATGDMKVLLETALTDRGVGFERSSNILTVRGISDHAKVIGLLRQMLSDPERAAVSVITAKRNDFPVPVAIDEWWRMHETDWFSRALAQDRFTSWFQPIVDTGTSQVFAHECLIRLQGSRMYGGGEILDAARVRKEIHAFDSYARRLAIRCAGRNDANALYFVNFSPSSIYNPEFCMQSTMEQLQISGMRPENVVFEVIESDRVQESAHLRRICDFYRRHGFRFALDDVGTGANSLQLVCDLRPDYIKLDKSLVQNVEQPMYAATIRKLIELADQFGLKVIAEGVETPSMMEDLWLLGARYMQGYLFGRPAPAPVAAACDLAKLSIALEAPGMRVPVQSLVNA